MSASWRPSAARLTLMCIVLAIVIAGLAPAAATAASRPITPPHSDRVPDASGWQPLLLSDGCAHIEVARGAGTAITGTFAIAFAGLLQTNQAAPQYLFSMDLSNAAASAPDCYQRDASIAIPPRAAWLVAHYPPEAGLTDTEAAARQAAIWAVTDGYVTSGPTAVKERAAAILATIPDPVPQEYALPQAELSITPAMAFNPLTQRNHTLTIWLEQGEHNLDQTDIRVQTDSGQFVEYPAGTAITPTTSLTVRSGLPLVLRSASAEVASLATITATAAGQGRVSAFSSPTGSQKLIGAESGSLSAWAVKRWRQSGLFVVKFEDANHSGGYDQDESFLEGWAMRIHWWDGAAWNPILTSMTTQGGGGTAYFALDGWSGWATLEEGSTQRFKVVETPQTGWTCATCTGPKTPPLKEIEFLYKQGDAVLLTFGNARLGVIEVVKYLDLDGDGVKDAGESTLTGMPHTWHFRLLQNVSGKWQWRQSATADASGRAYFTGVADGDYRIEEVNVPFGWQPSRAYIEVAGFSATEQRTVSYGNRRCGSLTGIKYLDADGDGARSGGDEVGLSGWTIVLQWCPAGDCAVGSDAGWQAAGSTATGANGGYAFAGLSPGLYRVSESLQPGWVKVTPPGEWQAVTLAWDESLGAMVQEPASADFGNLQLGSLTVTKRIDWRGVTPVAGARFTICIAGPSYPYRDGYAPGACMEVISGGPAPVVDYELDWSDLLPGSYSVSEPYVEGDWVVEITGSPAEVPVGGAPQTRPVVTNARKLGSLTLTKTVDWDGAEAVPGQQFSICLRGPSFPGGSEAGACRSFDGGDAGPWTQTWDGLVPGDYTVTEQTPQPSGAWHVTGNSQTVVVGTEAVAQAEVINRLERGSLQVTKVVDWDGAAELPTRGFTICIGGPSYPTGTEVGACRSFDGSQANPWTQTWQDLIQGEYTVTEADPGSAWLVSGGNDDVAVSAGCRATHTVSNTYKRGSLTVTKKVDWSGVTPVAGTQFSLCITGPSFPNGDCKSVAYGGSAQVAQYDVTWADLIAGSYAVSEVDPGGEWTVAITGSPATVPAGGAPQTKPLVTNTRKLGALEVTKVVLWSGVPVDQQQTFTICIAGPGYPYDTATGYASGACKTVPHDGGVLSWSGLIPGNYTVREVDPGVNWSVTAPADPVVVPADGGTTQAEVTNTRLLGALRVTKAVDWRGIAPDTTQTFKICISGPSYPQQVGGGHPAGACRTLPHTGGSTTWYDLIPGEYVVTEVGPGPQWLVSISGSPASVPPGSGAAAVQSPSLAVPVREHAGAEVTVRNVRKLGRLEITKLVDWSGRDPDPAKTFRICTAGPSYPLGQGGTHPAGACQTTGWQGGVLVWTDLVPGQYTITEEEAGLGWVAEIVDSPVTVPVDGGTAKATVINIAPVPGPPTAVTLIDWSLSPGADGVLHRWTTVMEVGTASFRLYRGSGPEREAAGMAQEVPAQGAPGAGNRTTYEWRDGGLLAGTYHYWLVEVTHAGQENLLAGPRGATVGVAPADGQVRVYLPLATGR